MPVEPITHLEKSIAGTVEPVTHLEKSIAGAVEPVTHLEKVIDQYGGGGEAVLIQKTITANGTFAAADDNADGYSSVTVDVQGSGTDYFQYARGLDGMFSIPYTTTYLFPFEEISINAPLTTSIRGFWSTGAFNAVSQKPRGVKKITLNIKNINVGTAAAFNGTPDLEEIVINADNAVGYLERGIIFAKYLPGLKKITGIVFNGNNASWTRGTSAPVLYFPTGSALEEIRFVPNSMSCNDTYQLAQHGNLSDDSLVSIANAMDASGSVNVTKTVNLHASAAGKLSTIMGTVTDGVFALDTNGTTTLLDFITQTKGWTVS